MNLLVINQLKSLFVSSKVSKFKNISPLSVIIFFGYLLIFLILDYLNLPYPKMAQQYGWSLVATNLLLNFLMAGLGAYLLYLNQALLDKSGANSWGENLSFVAVIFGMLTYGCTPCVIAFFASLGIGFSVIVLPLAGLPYKLISLGLILIGLLWLKNDLKKTTCQI